MRYLCNGYIRLRVVEDWSQLVKPAEFTCCKQSLSNDTGTVVVARSTSAPWMCRATVDPLCCCECKSPAGHCFRAMKTTNSGPNVDVGRSLMAVTWR